MMNHKTTKDKKIKVGVVGYPINHTLSPRLHSYWLKKYNINGTYEAIEKSPEEIEDFITHLSSYGFAGLNITLPYKEIAAKFVNILDENANRLGAINTIYMDSDGILHGVNTDGFGFIENLISNVPTWKPSDGPAVVLGAGGAAKAVVASLLDRGLDQVFVANRTQKKAKALKEKIGGSIYVINWDERSKILKDVALIINTTSLGMIGQPPLNIDLNLLPKKAIVYDIVYSPMLTPLLKSGQKRSHKIVGGIGMLLHQARPGFQKWFGRDPKVTETLKNHVILELQK